MWCCLWSNGRKKESSFVTQMNSSARQAQYEPPSSPDIYDDVSPPSPGVYFDDRGENYNSSSWARDGGMQILSTTAAAATHASAAVGGNQDTNYGSGSRGEHGDGYYESYGDGGTAGGYADSGYNSGGIITDELNDNGGGSVFGKDDGDVASERSAEGGGGYSSGYGASSED